MTETQEETIRRVKEQAWDEGYLAAAERRPSDRSTHKTNPYRKSAESQDFVGPYGMGNSQPYS